MSKVVNFQAVKVSCAQCNLSQLCMPRGLSNDEFESLSDMVKRERPLQKGETLFKLGQSFTSLYAVRSGSLKSFLPANAGGEEQIVGFNMPGELLGFDGISHNSHNCTAMALEQTSVCEMPFNRLQELCLELPSLKDHFLSLMSQEIVSEHGMMQMLARKSAEARLATFLLDLSNRYKRRGFSPTQFNLTMSRHDIANYLGLAVETVSRIMTHLQEAGMIQVERRFMSLLDLEQLQKLSGTGNLASATAQEKA